MAHSSLYTATFSAVATTAAVDLFEIVAPSDSVVYIHEMTCGQYSDYGDAEAEGLSIVVYMDYSTSGSGGSTLTPVGLDATEGRTAGSTVESNNTTQASGGTPLKVAAGTWNVQGGFVQSLLLPAPIILKPSQRLVYAQSAPADSITMNGTLVFEERGF